MAICKYCQATIAYQSKFCKNCGKADPVLVEEENNNVVLVESYNTNAENDNREKTIWTGTPSTIVIWPHWFLLFITFGLWFPVFIYYYLKLTSYIFTITTHRITVRAGLFSKTTEIVELYRIRDYQLDEPLVYRIFGGYSNLILQTKDSTNPTTGIVGVKNGHYLLDQIRKNVEIQRSTKRRIY
jgi:membrane protein YdbS with pleckstrin-like domain